MTALMLPAVASAASSGPNYGTGTSAFVTGADANWTNPQYIGADDTNYATCNNIPDSGGTSYLLFAKNLGFAIPSRATIDGISVAVNRQSSGAMSPFLRDNVVQLTKDGTALVGTNLAVLGTDWPTAALQTATYGGAANLWGTTWTPADVNSTNFGIALQARNANTNAGRTRNATVDYIRVTVTYTPVASTIPVTVTATVTPKTYDGTMNASATLDSADLLPGDNVTLTYDTATFATKNVGDGLAVLVDGIQISGPDASQFALTATTADATSDITARDLTVTATGVNKDYDATTDATVTLATDAIAGDDVTAVNTAAAFDTKDVGTDKPVDVSGISISGADSGNYTLLNDTAATTANIAAIDLTVTATGVNKDYDATTDATVTLATDAIAGDDVTADYTAAAFDTKDVGTDKPVDVSGISVSGTDSGNYNTPSDTATTTANIAAIDLTVDGAVAEPKTYDGTLDATVDFTSANPVGVLTGDTVTLDTAAYTAAFDTKDVDVAKPVTVDGVALAGADAGNYTVSQPSGLTADITVKGLIVTASGLSKVYDGTTAAQCTLESNKVAGDVVTIAYTAAFDSKNVGAAKPIAVSDIAISGADAANYDLKNTTADTTADITAKALTIAAKDQAKAFGIQFVFTGTEFTSTGLVSGDTVTTVVLASSGAQASAVPGTYPIVGRGATGTGLDNYAIAYVDGKLTVSGGYTVASFAKPLRSSDARKFHPGDTIKVAFKVKDVNGKAVTTAKPTLKLKKGSKVVLNVKAVKYNKSKKMYIYNIKTKASWKTASYKITVGLGAGSTGRSVGFKLIK